MSRVFIHFGTPGSVKYLGLRDATGVCSDGVSSKNTLTECVQYAKNHQCSKDWATKYEVFAILPEDYF